MDFSMAFETDWNGILDVVRATIGMRHDVIGLHLYTAEPVADAATPMTLRQKHRDLILRKCHSWILRMKASVSAAGGVMI
jgi:hypothetical protein